MSDRYLSLDDHRDYLRDLIEDHPDLAAEFERRYEMSWIFHEAGLEGLVLTEQEILQALEVQVVADASMMQVLNVVRNQRSGLQLAKEEAAKPKGGKLGMPLCQAFYEALDFGKDPAKPMMRKEMPLHRAYYHDIAQPAKIAPELQKLFDFTASPEFREFHPVKQAAYVHWQFMQVYPFSDHNGRVARLLQNVYLIRAGYPPAIIHAIDRMKYYDALRLPLATLRTVLSDALENSLQNAAKFIKAMRAAQIRKAVSE